MDVELASKLSFKNKDKLIDDISCYFCFRYHKVTDITDWADKSLTALCPHCDMDTILPGIIDRDNLIKIHRRWFTLVP